MKTTSSGNFFEKSEVPCHRLAYDGAEWIGGQLIGNAGASLTGTFKTVPRPAMLESVHVEKSTRS